MVDFFVWRDCDLSGTGAAQAIQASSDVLSRAVALLEAPGGLPADDVSRTGGPALDVVSADWGSPSADGALPAGEHTFALVPIDTCTGRTGTRIPLPSLTTAANARATLRVSFGLKPPPCAGVLLERDGRIVTGPISLRGSVLDNVPIVTAGEAQGTYEDGTVSSFTRLAGADLIVGDSITYQGRVVRVTAIAGDSITFSPPIAFTDQATPDGYFDLGERTGIYFSTGVPIGFFAGALFLPQPLAAFHMPISLGLFADPQIGDLIVYGSKTAIVVAKNLVSLLGPGFYDIGVIPFGLLPLPPAPAGQFFLVSRPLAPFTPTFGTYFRLSLTPGAPGPVDDPQPFNKFEVNGDEDDEDLPGRIEDPNLQVGAVLWVNGAIVEVTAVEHGVNIAGAPDPTKGRITFEPGFSRSEQVNSFPGGFALPDNAVPVFDSLAFYTYLPPNLAGLFLQTPTIPATGTYSRQSRSVNVTTRSNLWQIQDDGSVPGRYDDTEGTGAGAAKAFDDGSKYPGGLSAFLSTLRGDRSTEPSRVFTDTNGSFTSMNGQLFAVNAVADGQTVVRLDAIRALNECASLEYLFPLLSESVVVYRYEAQEISVPADPCDPTGASTRQVVQQCLGPASREHPLMVGETAVVRWVRRGEPNALASLQAVGLTRDEAVGAISLAPVGRVTQVIDGVPQESLDALQMVEDTLLDGGLDAMDDVLRDRRIVTLDPGPITSVHVDAHRRRRGRGGVARRENGADDFVMSAVEVAALLLSGQFTLDDCGLDDALALIPNEADRNAVASVFAYLEGNATMLRDAGGTLLRYLRNDDFAAARDAVAGFVAGVSADPTLFCLFGPANVSLGGVPRFSGFETALSVMIPKMQARFEILSHFSLGLQALLCTAASSVARLLPGNDPLLQAVGCIPADLPVFSANIPISLSLQCSLDRFNVVRDLVDDLLDEVNETLDFLNALSVSIVARSGTGPSNQCSGDESLEQVIARASSFIFSGS